MPSCRSMDSRHPTRSCLARTLPTTRGWRVNVIGFLDDALGLAQAARLYIDALDAAGVPVATTAIAPDAPAGLRRKTIERYGKRTHEELRATFEPAFNLACLNGDHLVRLARTAGGEVLARRPTIGQWAWETDVLPADWLPAFQLLEEIWAFSTFVGDNLGRLSPVPVVVVPMAVTVPDPSGAELPIARDDRFTFLFMFDFFSTLRRKNAAGLIEAFERAFAPGEGPRLLLKTINGRLRPEAEAELRREIGPASGYRADRRVPRSRPECGPAGSRRLLCVAAPQRGLRAHARGVDGARHPGDRHRLLGQHWTSPRPTTATWWTGRRLASGPSARSIRPRALGRAGSRSRRRADAAGMAATRGGAGEGASGRGRTSTAFMHPRSSDAWPGLAWSAWPTGRRVPLAASGDTGAWARPCPSCALSRSRTSWRSTRSAARRLEPRGLRGALSAGSCSRLMLPFTLHERKFDRAVVRRSAGSRSSSSENGRCVWRTARIKRLEERMLKGQAAANSSVKESSER